MRIERLDDAQQVTNRVAEVIAEGLVDAVRRRGRAVLALSGGSTPKPLYRRLAGVDLDWDRVTVVQVDERFAPDGDPRRNWTSIDAELVDPTAATGQPMPTGGAVAPDLVEAYAERLQGLSDGIVDVAHLGLGDDGHTASLVPEDPVLDARSPVAITQPYDGLRRMTMTASTLNRARRIVWQVVGSSKRQAVTRLLDGDPSVPAHLIRRDDDVWLVVDAAALGRSDGERSERPRPER